MNMIKSHKNNSIVSNIKYFNDSTIYSMAKDRNLIKYEIINDKLIQNHVLKFTHIVNEIDNIFFNEENDLILTGFIGNYFVIYNYTKRYRVNY